MKKGIDYIGVTASFFCHDGKGKFIFAKRSKNARDERGNWDNGGGAIEFLDTAEQTIRKEIKEEYCVDVLGTEFLGYRDVFRVNHEGQQTHWVSLDFKVLVDPTGMKIGEPHKFDDIGWFSLDSLPSPLHSQVPFALKKYKEKLCA